MMDQGRELRCAVVDNHLVFGFARNCLFDVDRLWQALHGCHTDKKHSQTRPSSSMMINLIDLGLKNMTRA
jgi:hypothetical protein